MTRTELIERLSRHFPRLTQSDTQLAVSFILISMAKALMAGRRMEFRGFGALSTGRRPARISRNPKTGEPVEVPSKRTIRWKSGKDLQARLNSE